MTSFRAPKLLLVCSTLALATVAGCTSEPVSPGSDSDPIQNPLGLLNLGDVINLNVNGLQSCSNASYHPARVMAIGSKSIIFADTLNPRNGFTTADFQRFAARFDTLVYPLLVENFGEPTDIDKNGRISILFTRAVNELTPARSSSYVGGFAFSRDLFPITERSRAEGCATSNQGEYFYALAPDPTGSINQNVRSTSFVDSITTSVLAHELQHIINASRRLYVTNAAGFEEKWLDEGMAHIAEELLFYREAKLAPRMNLDINGVRASNAIRNAYNSDIAGNASRLRQYLLQPNVSSPYALDDSLPTRGAAWSFLRYAVDRVNAVDGFAPGGGQVITGQGSATIAAVAAAQEYSATLVNTTTTPGGPAVSFTLSVSGAAAQPSVAFAPVPSLVRIPAWEDDAGPQRDVAFESRLRARERADLTPRIAAARAWFATQGPPAASMMRSGASVSTSGTVADADGVIWAKLVNNNLTGIDNLRSVTGQDIAAFIRDWSVSNAVDDVAAPSTQYQQRSWNWHSIYPNLGAGGGQYPLQVSNIGPGSVLSSSAVAGGAAYFNILVPAGASPVVSLSSVGSTPNSNLQLVLVRTK